MCNSTNKGHNTKCSGTEKNHSHEVGMVVSATNKTQNSKLSIR